MVENAFVDSRLWASLGSLVVRQLNLYRKHIPLSRYRVPHYQEADVFVVERSAIVIIEAKVGISANFSIFKAIIVHIVYPAASRDLCRIQPDAGE